MNRRVRAARTAVTLPLLLLLLLLGCYSLAAQVFAVAASKDSTCPLPTMIDAIDSHSFCPVPRISVLSAFVHSSQLQSMASSVTTVSSRSVLTSLKPQPATSAKRRNRPVLATSSSSSASSSASVLTARSREPIVVSGDQAEFFRVVRGHIIAMLLYLTVSAMAYWLSHRHILSSAIGLPSTEHHQNQHHQYRQQQQYQQQYQEQQQGTSRDVVGDIVDTMLQPDSSSSSATTSGTSTPHPFTSSVVSRQRSKSITIEELVERRTRFWPKFVPRLVITLSLAVIAMQVVLFGATIVAVNYAEVMAADSSAAGSSGENLSGTSSHALSSSLLTLTACSLSNTLMALRAWLGFISPTDHDRYLSELTPQKCPVWADHHVLETLWVYQHYLVQSLIGILIPFTYLLSDATMRFTMRHHHNRLIRVCLGMALIGMTQYSTVHALCGIIVPMAIEQLAIHFSSDSIPAIAKIAMNSFRLQLYGELVAIMLVVSIYSIPQGLARWIHQLRQLPLAFSHQKRVGRALEIAYEQQRQVEDEIRQLQQQYSLTASLTSDVEEHPNAVEPIQSETLPLSPPRIQPLSPVRGTENDGWLVARYRSVPAILRYLVQANTRIVHGIVRTVGFNRRPSDTAGVTTSDTAAPAGGGSGSGINLRRYGRFAPLAMPYLTPRRRRAGVAQRSQRIPAVSPTELELERLSSSIKALREYSTALVSHISMLQASLTLLPWRKNCLFLLLTFMTINAWFLLLVYVGISPLRAILGGSDWAWMSSTFESTDWDGIIKSASDSTPIATETAKSSESIVSMRISIDRASSLVFAVILQLTLSVAALILFALGFGVRFIMDRSPATLSRIVLPSRPISSLFNLGPLSADDPFDQSTLTSKVVPLLKSHFLAADGAARTLFKHSPLAAILSSIRHTISDAVRFHSNRKSRGVLARLYALLLLIHAWPTMCVVLGLTHSGVLWFILPPFISSNSLQVHRESQLSSVGQPQHQTPYNSLDNMLSDIIWPLYAPSSTCNVMPPAPTTTLRPIHTASAFATTTTTTAAKWSIYDLIIPEYHAPFKQHHNHRHPSQKDATKVDMKLAQQSMTRFEYPVSELILSVHGLVAQPVHLLQGLLYLPVALVPAAWPDWLMDSGELYFSDAGSHQFTSNVECNSSAANDTDNKQFEQVVATVWIGYRAVFFIACLDRIIRPLIVYILAVMAKRARFYTARLLTSYLRPSSSSLTP